jgi:hypothetical protein
VRSGKRLKGSGGIGSGFMWTPLTCSVAAQVTTTKKPMTPVSMDPMTTSRRSYRRSSTVSFLSTAYDWIKLSPQGASVVPTVAVTTKIAFAVSGIRGTSRPVAAYPQSGWVTKPAAM